MTLTLLRVRSYPRGAVELTVSPEVPEVRWRSPEIEHPFCGAFGVPGFQKVSRDAKGRIHLAMVPFALSNPDTTLETLIQQMQTHSGAIPLGESAMGPVFWDPRQVAHLILAGTTGSGKSTLLRSILTLWKHRGASIYLVDVKRGLDYLDLLPHLAAPVLANPAEAVTLLEQLWQEFESRLEQLRQSGFSSFAQAQNQGQLRHLPEIVLVVDEFAIFARSESTKAAKETRLQALQILENLALGGRAGGLHLILSTQYPTAEILGSQIRQQALRISGRLEDKVASQTVLGTEGAESISSTTPGRFLMKDGPDVVEFQAYALPSPGPEHGFQSISCKGTATRP
ncbi:cell division protein FtsK [Alicyclobacillaceae bacterium I2511]|nr:cell division protein FtsK [Alicyclobacillaceae bacterium I2511]